VLARYGVLRYRLTANLFGKSVAFRAALLATYPFFAFDSS
jgi:hypothetical protein